MGSEMILWGT